MNCNLNSQNCALKRPKLWLNSVFAKIYVERKKVSNMQIFFIDINHSHIHNYKDDVKHFEYIDHPCVITAYVKINTKLFAWIYQREIRWKCHYNIFFKNLNQQRWCWPHSATVYNNVKGEDVQVNVSAPKSAKWENNVRKDNTRKNRVTLTCEKYDDRRRLSKVTKIKQKT